MKTKQLNSLNKRIIAFLKMNVHVAMEEKFIKTQKRLRLVANYGKIEFNNLI